MSTESIQAKMNGFQQNNITNKWRERERERKNFCSQEPNRRLFSTDTYSNNHNSNECSHSPVAQSLNWLQLYWKWKTLEEWLENSLTSEKFHLCDFSTENLKTVKKGEFCSLSELEKVRSYIYILQHCNVY